MTETLEAVRTIASEYLAGRVSLDILDSEVANLAESPRIDEPGLRDLWGQLELLLAELTNGHLDEAEFRADLAKLVPINAVIGAGTVIRVTTGTSARSFTNPVGGLFPSPAAGKPVGAVSG